MIDYLISIVFQNYKLNYDFIIKNKRFLKRALHSQKVEERIAVSIDEKGNLQFWDLNLRICISKKKIHKGYISSLLKINDNTIATGGIDNKIKIFHRQNLIAILKGHQEGIISLNISNKYLVSSSDDMTIKFWNLQNFTLVNTIVCDSWTIASINLSGLLVTANDEGDIYYYDTVNNFHKMSAHKQTITCMVKLSETKYATGSWDKSIRIADINYKETLSLKGHTDWILNLFKLEKYLISTGYDNKINIWDIDTLKVIKTIDAHMVRSVIYCDENELIYISGKNINIIDLNTFNKKVIKNGSIFTNMVLY